MTDDGADVNPRDGWRQQRKVNGEAAATQRRAASSGTAEAIREIVERNRETIVRNRRYLDALHDRKQEPDRLRVATFAPRSRWNTSGMSIEGVSLSASSVALLALRLARAGHSTLAQRLGVAVDRNIEAISLLPGEKTKVLAVLDDAPDALRPLRDALVQLRR